MHFARDARVSHPAPTILEIMIERMEAIVPFLPSVESIEVQARESLDDRIRIIRRWQGTADKVPTAVRPFVSRDLLAWIDTAMWTPAAHKVDWTLSTVLPSVAGLYSCGGVNYFEPAPDDPERATRIRITGDLTVFPDRLPGVPRFLGSTLAPQIERFVVNLITPNLTEVADGLQRYLDQQPKRRTSPSRPGKSRK